jgi:hypothetical protein
MLKITHYYEMHDGIVSSARKTIIRSSPEENFSSLLAEVYDKKVKLPR